MDRVFPKKTAEKMDRVRHFFPYQKSDWELDGSCAVKIRNYYQNYLGKKWLQTIHLLNADFLMWQYGRVVKACD